VKPRAQLTVYPADHLDGRLDVIAQSSADIELAALDPEHRHPAGKPPEDTGKLDRLVGSCPEARRTSWRPPAPPPTPHKRDGDRRIADGPPGWAVDAA
jgi:hypothetical protein